MREIIKKKTQEIAFGCDGERTNAVRKGAKNIRERGSSESAHQLSTILPIAVEFLTFEKNKNKKG